MTDGPVLSGKGLAGLEFIARGGATSRRCAGLFWSLARQHLVIGVQDATSEAIRDWVTNVETTHYILGSAAGPHPYPMMVRNLPNPDPPGPLYAVGASCCLKTQPWSATAEQRALHMQQCTNTVVEKW